MAWRRDRQRQRRQRGELGRILLRVSRVPSWRTGDRRHVSDAGQRRVPARDIREDRRLSRRILSARGPDLLHAPAGGQRPHPLRSVNRRQTRPSQRGDDVPGPPGKDRRGQRASTRADLESRRNRVAPGLAAAPPVLATCVRLRWPPAGRRSVSDAPSSRSQASLAGMFGWGVGFAGSAAEALRRATANAAQ